MTQNIEPGASDFCVQDRSKSLSSIRIHTGAIRITKINLLIEKQFSLHLCKAGPGDDFAKGFPTSYFSQVVEPHYVPPLGRGG